MLRLVDLIAIVAVAVVLLLPQASIEARPALEGEHVELDRIAHLQDDAFREPDNAEVLLQLADGFLSFGRADWAIASLSRFTAAEQRGEAWTQARLVRSRVHLTLATARAERLEAGETVAEAKLAEAQCDPALPECVPVLVRAQMIHSAMQALLDKNIDPAQDPQRAKSEVYKAIHPSRSAFPSAH